MWVWGKAQGMATDATTVARAAVEGKPREDLLGAAVGTLLASRQADRFGVWLEDPASSLAVGEVNVSFRGVVSEKQGDSTPPEWSRLAPESPLPAELLVGLRTVEQELENSTGQPMIGALIEMRRAMWVPVKTQGQLRGIVFAGQREKQARFPQALLESVAAELALTLELEEERRLGRERLQDSRQVLDALGSSQSPGAILDGIVNACTQPGGPQDRASAVFAAIGRLMYAPPDADKGPTPLAARTVSFLWQSGAPAWRRSLETEAISGVWRRALDSRQVAGTQSANACSSGGVTRVVAWPLQAGGESLGVLVAGLCPGSASLAVLERFELSAALAACTLRQLKRNEEGAEQELRQSAVLAAVGAAFLEVRSDGSIEQFSDGARAILGAHPAEPNSSQDFSHLFSTLDVPRVQAWLRTAQASAGQGFLAAQQILPEAHLHNGTRVRLQAVYATKKGDAGIVLEPLPEENQKAQAEHGAAEILNLIEWLEEGVVLFGANREIRAWNVRFGQMLGLSPKELESMKTLDDLAAALVARTDGGKFAANGTDWHPRVESATREELHLVRPVPRLLERFTRPILDPKGALLGRVEIYRDLTAQRVLQSKLLQTEKLAELGQMVTNIAHELSNPLTSILGYAQRLLLRRDRAGESAEARQIFQEAERASGILRQLLLSARESRPERRRVALNQVVSRTLELQRFGLTAGKVHVQLDLDPVLPFVLGDAGQLQQVLVNLIGNARQAFEEQGRAGTIRVKTLRIAEKRVLLEVSDDGPGIPQSIQARIFDPFFTTKPAGVGTGLGLAIVLAIVREHGGTVHLTSTIGRGTVFSIELPAAAVLEVPLPGTGGSRPGRHRLESWPAPQPIKATQMRALLGPWAGARVLVLEDEPTVARLIADVLEDEGLRVDVLLDAREALDRAAQVEYALVVCDMKMPEVNGEHFYQALAHAGNPLHARFLFVTGDVLAAHTRDFLERNHLPHVAKPFRVEELTEKIRIVLESSSPREPSQAPTAKKNAARK